MLVKEVSCAFGSFLQEPDYVVLNDSNKSKVLRLLLVPQDHHRVVWVIHLVQLLRSLPTVEVVFYYFYVVFFQVFVFIFFFLLLRKLFPDVTSVFVRDIWRNWVVLNEHAPGQEHVLLLDLLVDDQSVRVSVNAQQNVGLVQANFEHLLDCLRVCREAHVTV